MIHQEDLRIELYRNAGVIVRSDQPEPDFALRITHLPTGRVAERHGRRAGESQLSIKASLIRELNYHILYSEALRFAAVLDQLWLNHKISVHASLSPGSPMLFVLSDSSGSREIRWNGREECWRVAEVPHDCTGEIVT